MPVFISIPVLWLLVMFQTAIASRMQLLHGTTDLVMLALIGWALQQRVQSAWQWSLIGGVFMALISALPIPVFPASYLVITAFALLLRRRIWKIPILAMLALTVGGTLLTQGLTIISLFISGAPVPLLEALNLITLPSVLLNILLSVPMYVIMGDLANWLYPLEVEV